MPPMPRRKRRSKYDISRLYEGSSSKRPYYLSQPGQSKFYDHENKKDANTLDPSLNLRPMKDRTVFTDEQMFILEHSFQREKHPNNEVRQLVANLTDLSVERVRIWYQNRRAKEKRDQEDELALLAEKLKLGSSVYTTSAYPCRSTLHQKLNQLNQIFSPNTNKTDYGNDCGKYLQQQISSDYQQPRKVRKINHPHNMSPNLLSEGFPSSNSAIESSELECVRNLLKTPSEKQYTGNNNINNRRLPGIESFSKQPEADNNRSPGIESFSEQLHADDNRLPGIESFSKQLQATNNKKEKVSHSKHHGSKRKYDSESHSSRENSHSESHSSRGNSDASSARRGYEDDERRYIKSLMKSDSSKTRSNKYKRKETTTSSKSSSNSQDNIQCPSTTLTNADSLSSEQVNLPSQNMPISSYVELLASDQLQGGNLLSTVNDFQNYFTPEQLNLLQLLNQRSLLEQFQLMYSGEEELIEKNESIPTIGKSDPTENTHNMDYEYEQHLYPNLQEQIQSHETTTIDNSTFNTSTEEVITNYKMVKHVYEEICDKR